MKKVMLVPTLFFSVLALVGTARAADDMAGMKMESGTMGTATQDNSALTDAVVKQVDPSTGMVTLQHGDMKNIGMSAMTMAYKAKDVAMVKQLKEGEKVKVRVENINGTLTIVKLMKP